MKHIIILGDGMADWPVESLGGKTLMQYAKTPYMDKLASMGRTGRLKTVADGFHPGSEVANMSVAGHYFKIAAQKLLNGFCLCRRLNDNQILCHSTYFISRCGSFTSFFGCKSSNFVSAKRIFKVLLLIIVEKQWKLKRFL